MGDRDPEILAKLDQIISEQRRQAESIAELRGQLMTALQWLSSMDQRFMALMHPYNAPTRPAAE
jgi:hypothetical protein